MTIKLIMTAALLLSIFNFLKGLAMSTLFQRLEALEAAEAATNIAVAAITAPDLSAYAKEADLLALAALVGTPTVPPA